MANRVGEQLAQYEMKRLLGRGERAEVYLGEHRFLKSLAAIKVLQATLNEKESEEFLSEARTLASLRHPHIVGVLDFNVEQGTPFLVMDYASGGTLREQYPRGSTVPLATVVSYVSQIAEALQYAHNKGFIHRDVKPENLLLSQRGTVLLGDFGTALLLQASRVQSVQEVVGTISYMAPEQLQGRPQRASDQYALGVVVYEWLSGDHPFDGSFSEIASQHLFAAPPSLRARIPTIPPGVEDVITKALAKDPQDRFVNVQAFATALAEAAIGQVTVTPSDNTTPSLNIQPSQTHEDMVAELPAHAPVYLPEQVSSPLVTPSSMPGSANTPDLPEASKPTPPPAWTLIISRSKRLFWTRLSLLALIALLIIGGSVGVYYTAAKYRVANGYASATGSANAAETATLNAFETGLATASTGQAINAAANTVTLENASATANAQINALATADALTATNSIMFGLNAQHTNFNPREHILSPANVAHLQLKWVHPLIDSYHEGYASPMVINGIMYVCAFDKALYAFDATTGTVLWSAPVPAALVYSLIDSAPAIVNGVIYVGSVDGYLYAFDTSTRKILWKEHAGNAIDTSPTVAEGRVFVASQDNNLHAFDARTGQSLWTAPAGPPPPPGMVSSFASPAVDNGIVYFGSWDANLYAFDAKSGTSLWIGTTRGPIFSSPTVANGLVYIGDWLGNIYAFDARMGTLNWYDFLGVKVENGKTVGEAILSTPAVANGLVYLNSIDGRLFAFDAYTGAKLAGWKVPFTNLVSTAATSTTPTIANGVVYYGPLDSHLYAINAATGALLWSYPVGNMAISTPNLINGTVYVGSDTGLYAFYIPGVSP